MKYTTIFEKLLCIFELISKSWLNITFVILTSIFLVLLGLKKISKKKCFLFVTLTCFGLLLFTFYQYFEPLSKMMDSLIDNLFTNIYFPSTYAYLFILVVTDVIAIGGLLNPKIDKVYKTIHGVCFIVINFILTIILEMVAKYEIDVFSKSSMFANTDFVTLLEFSVNVFIIWLVSLLITYLVNIITERVVITKNNKETTEVSNNVVIPEVTISDEEIKEEYEQVQDTVEVPASKTETVAFIPDTTKNHFIPTIITPVVQEIPNTYTFKMSSVGEPVTNQFVAPQSVSVMEQKQNTYTYQNGSNNTFDLSSFIPRKQEVRPIQNFNIESTPANKIFEQILKNELPVIHEEPIRNTVEDAIQLEKDTYTLNDYKVFNKMLKDIREHNQSNSVQIDKMLEYRLITKYSTETYQMFRKMLKIYSN